MFSRFMVYFTGSSSSLRNFSRAPCKNIKHLITPPPLPDSIMTIFWSSFNEFNALNSSLVKMKADWRKTSETKESNPFQFGPYVILVKSEVRGYGFTFDFPTQ